ncbi:MAG: class IV adenylate cyclase [Methanomicrobiaceae archaeon]|nr:class IV adenylate cyclase [Methanomicrobiaceae archaeon]
MLEVEAKIKIDSINIIRTRLKEKGAVFAKKTLQTDTYYNSPLRDFAKTDEALRIRNEEGLSEITYKGPKMRNSVAKAREEYNVEVTDAESLAIILEKSGFTKSTTVSKTREEYDFMGAKIALDIVKGLGEFIEIEVVTDNQNLALETIEKIREELGISGEHIAESYLEMIQAKNER